MTRRRAERVATLRQRAGEPPRTVQSEPRASAFAPRSRRSWRRRSRPRRKVSPRARCAFPPATPIFPPIAPRRKKAGRFPTVLVIHEIFGVHEHIKDVCRRLAKLGYYAIAPDFSPARATPPPRRTSNVLMQTIVAKTPDAEVASDLDATLAFAKASGKADVDAPPSSAFAGADGRPGSTPNAIRAEGGRRLVWPARLPDRDAQAGQSARHRRGLEGSRARALWRSGQGHSARQDRGDAGQARRGGGGSKIIVYADAGHAFFADYRPSYVKADAEASWKEATAWLKAHGV